MRHIGTCFVLAAIAMMTPRLATAGDVEIAQQIAAQLRAQKDAQQLRGFHIGVKVENSKVWMKGQVSDSRQQMLALDIARRIPGVKMVVNELHVTQATAAAASPVPTLSVSALPAQPAPTLQQPASALVAARRQVAAASAVELSAPATTPQMPQMAPIIVQPAVSQPAIATQTQVPAPTFATARVTSSPAPIAPSVARPVGSAVATPAVTRRAVPSLQVGQPLGTPVVRQQTAVPAAVQNVPVARQLMAAPAPRPIARMAAYADSGPAASTDTLEPATPVSSVATVGGGVPGVVYDHPSAPGYAWPSYAAHPNYAGVTYPTQYSATAWPYIGPFYPYPQVPLGWRKVTLEWDDGWWFLDFTSK